MAEVVRNEAIMPVVEIEAEGPEVDVVDEVEPEEATS